MVLENVNRGFCGLGSGWRMPRCVCQAQVEVCSSAVFGRCPVVPGAAAPSPRLVPQPALRVSAEPGASGSAGRPSPNGLEQEAGEGEVLMGVLCLYTPRLLFLEPFLVWKVAVLVTGSGDGGSLAAK